MGAVTLLVGDLDAMTRYYRDVVTLAGDLGRGRHRHAGPRGRPIVVLRHEPALRHASPGSAGLFHTAILFETQAALAAALYSRRPPCARHLHRLRGPPREPGVLLHRPRGQRHRAVLGPRAHDWSWTHGQVEMATLYLDPNDFLGEHLTEEAALGRDRRGRGIRRSRASVGGGCRDRARLLRRRARASTRPPRSAIRPCS